VQDDKFQLRINNQNVAGRINGGEYRVFDMKPATILISAVRTDIEEHYLKLNLEAGKVYYLKIQTGTFGEAFAFEEVSASEGQKDITNTALAGATGIDVTSYVPDFAGSTAGKEDGTVAVPAMTEAEIDAMIEKKLGQRAASIPAPVVATSVASKLSTMDEIDRAYQMKEKGIITQDEFNKIKAEILAK
ncbi:MAG: SHOCT domain-containing protein, partial [Sulfurimonas sp.]|nr:SHOCT domain-containing protein [Sulfurimonas sp.]